MARERRLWSEHALYHVYSRGSNRQPVVEDESDFVDWEQVVLDAARAEGVELHAWALLPNHWHAAVRCPVGGLSRFMKRANHRYALRHDRRWEKTGHLWQHRFGAVLQESELQYLWLLRYIVRNPLEAGLCDSVEGWRWTSWGPTVGERPAPVVLRVDEVLRAFDDDPEIALARYCAFIARA